MRSLHSDQHRVSVRLNLSTYGGALADPEYLRMVAPQFVLRKNVANLCAGLLVRSSSRIGGRANERVVTNRWTLLLLSGSLLWNISFREKWDPT